MNDTHEHIVGRDMRRPTLEDAGGSIARSPNGIGRAEKLQRQSKNAAVRPNRAGEHG